MADALATLERLRRLATDQARRDLAVCAAAERAATDRLEAARAAMQTEAASTPADAAHPLAGSYAIWLPAAQAARAAAASALRAAEHEVAAARAALAEARAAARAVETIAEQRAAAARQDRLRREQATADDLVSGRSRKDVLF